MVILLIMFAPHKAFQMQMGALSAFLKKYGYEVNYLEVIVQTGSSFDNYSCIIDKEIRYLKPDFVGFSSYDMNYPYIIDCANFIKNISSDFKIIVGGHHASLAPDDYMKFKSIDYVCVGEGEYAFKDLLEAFLKRKSVMSIKGLCSRNDEGKVIINAPRNLVENLDELPFVDRSVDKAISEHGKMYADHLPIMTSKGCPYSCTYCANESMKKLYSNSHSYVRFRTPKKVIEEIEACKKLYKFSFVIFYDDLFGLDFKWLKEFCELYIKYFPELPFHCLLRPEQAGNEKRLDLLYKAGCKNIKIGVEHGSQEYRHKRLNRKMTNEAIERAIALVKRHNMQVHIFMMVGLPGETFGDMIKSLWFNLKIGADFVQTAIYYPLKNTPLYKYCIKSKLIDEQHKRKLLVYSFDTCLNYSSMKRLLIIIFKWLHSGTPIIRHFRISLILRFLRIQFRRCFKNEIDYN